jgi:hypothetical protein
LLDESDPEPKRLAEAELGRLLPHLHYVARSWVLERVPELFEGGVEDPLRHPCWTGYLVNNPVYDTTFPDLRSWYLRAASFQSGRHDKSDSDYSLSRNLGLHVVFAYIFGLVGLGDSDQLLQKVFSTLTVEDRTHIYIQLFRAVPLDETTTQKLEELWDWRLNQLEGSPDSTFKSDEYEGLTAFIAIPLDAGATKSLGLRTLIGAKGVSQFESQVWQRVTTMVADDPIGTFPMVELLARTGMNKDPSSFFSFELAAQAIRTCLVSGHPATADKTKRLIHDLGESGFEEFGTLLEDR